FFQAEDGIRDFHVTGVQTCALPIYLLAKAGGPVLFLAGPVQQTFGHERAAGYRQALRAAGVEPDDRYILFAGGGSAQDGLRAVRSEERRGGKESRGRWSAWTGRGHA